MIERAGAGAGMAAGMARAQVWRGRIQICMTQEIELNTVGREIIDFVQDLDALYTEYRSFQRFPSLGVHGPWCARPIPGTVLFREPAEKPCSPSFECLRYVLGVLFLAQLVV